MNRRLKSIWKQMIGEKAWVTALGLLLAGFLLRLLFLEKLPWGLNQDEASAGYDAWALLHSGMDRNGKTWPVLFISWGSGQNVLMSYLAMPFIALLGLRPLSVRLPNALAGCMTLFVMWRLARRCRGERFGLLALLLLVINPWHIMASRWGLESNLLPALLWGACLFLSKTEEKPRALLGAAICLGLAPYAYGTAFFLLPPFLIWMLIRLRKSLRPGTVCASGAIFLALIIPIGVCQMLNILGGEEISVLGITLPRLAGGRQETTSVLGGGGLSGIRKNFLIFLEILHNGDDGVEYNALSFWRGGILYFFGLPLSVLGMIVSLRRRGEGSAEWPVKALLCCSVCCAVLIDGNINRLNMIWLPMIYYSALGGAWLGKHLQIRSVLPLAVTAFSFVYFAVSYVSSFAPPGHVKYFPGLGEAITAAEKMQPDTLYITDRIREPYIYALFYTTPPPERFMDSAEYVYHADDVMPEVVRFAGFEFTDPERADLLILTRSAAAEQGREILAVYGNFVICR